jgi:uncharacterized repeat protein (TIGR02543 family)
LKKIILLITLIFTVGFFAALSSQIVYAYPEPSESNGLKAYSFTNIWDFLEIDQDSYYLEFDDLENPSYIDSLEINGAVLIDSGDMDQSSDLENFYITSYDKNSYSWFTTVGSETFILVWLFENKIRFTNDGQMDAYENDEISLYIRYLPISDPVEPIITIEEFIFNQDVFQNLEGETLVSGKVSGYLEVPGLFRFSDIINFSGYEAYIVDGEWALDNSLELYGCTLVLDEILCDDELAIWVTPGKLHFTNWNNISQDLQYGIVLEYIYRTPGISGQAVFITNVDSPINESVIRASLVAYDETDGDITSSITKTSDTYTPNKNTVGDWQIVYSATDSSNNTTTFTVHVFVRDVVAPEVDPGDTELVLSYTTPITAATYPDDEFTMSDNYYDVEDLIITIISDNYTANKLIPGTYTIVYEIMDPSDNATYIEIEITVIDDIGPVFTGPTQITTTISSGLTLGNILQQYAAVDAIDGNLTAQIQVITNTFSANRHLAGDYLIVLRSTDSSGNITNHEITVTVSDNVAPVFFVTAAFISVAESITLTLEDIIRILYVTGQIDTLDVNVELNTYSGNSSTPGSYTMLLSYGSETLTLTINVTTQLENPVVYAIIFNSNGGTNVNNILVDGGTAATAPTPPTRTGYTFAGWFRNPSLTTPMNWSDPITADMMLYAKWTANSGGTPTPEEPAAVNFGLYILGGLGVVVILGALFSNSKKGRRY